MVLLKSASINKSTATDNKSTFHYGSIKIQKNDIRIETETKSTFHYGSIKIQRSENQCVKHMHLHSTMVLLKYIRGI